MGVGWKKQAPTSYSTRLELNLAKRYLGIVRNANVLPLQEDSTLGAAWRVIPVYLCETVWSRVSILSSKREGMSLGSIIKDFPSSYSACVDIF